MREFSETFKRQVVQEVLSGKLSKEEARRLYHIKGKSAILNWIRKFGINYPNYMSKQSLSEQELLSRIRRLEQELEDAKLTAEGYS